MRICISPPGAKIGALKKLTSFKYYNVLKWESTGCPAKNTGGEGKNSKNLRKNYLFQKNLQQIFKFTTIGL